MKARPLRCPAEPPDVEMRREVTRTLITHAAELPRPKPHLDLIGRTHRDHAPTRRRGAHHRCPARRGSAGALGPGYGRQRHAGASGELALAEPGVRTQRTQEHAGESSWVSGGLERLHGGQPTSDGGTPTGSDAEVWTTELGALRCGQSWRPTRDMAFRCRSRRPDLARSERPPMIPSRGREAAPDFGSRRRKISCGAGVGPAVSIHPRWNSCTSCSG